MSERIIRLSRAEAEEVRQWLEVKPVLNEADRKVKSLNTHIKQAVHESLAKAGVNDHVGVRLLAGSNFVWLNWTSPSYSDLITKDMVGQRLVLRKGFETLAAMPKE